MSDRYIEAVRGILNHLEEDTQIQQVEKAVDLVIESINGGGIIYCWGIGHGNEQDFINRAGGLAVVQPFGWTTSVNSHVPEVRKGSSGNADFEVDLETIRFAVKASNLKKGDVMITGSVSGRNRNPIELVLACQAIGVKTIAFTSLEYTSHVESLHPSGKKLCEAADVVIDNGAPYGDAAVDVPGYDYKVSPVSGVSMAVIGWMIWTRVMEKMAQRDNAPTVFMSFNREGGQEFYNKCIEQYNRRGY